MEHKQSDKDIKLAALGIVAGKTLKEWLDAPYGEFAKAVRAKIDQLKLHMKKRLIKCFP